MATKREYLKSKGITVGARGRFSAAAKQALQEATTNARATSRSRRRVCGSRRR